MLFKRFFNPTSTTTSTLNNDNSSASNTSSLIANNSITENKISPNSFEFMKVLGKGCMGKVLLGRHRVTGKTYAVKSISKSHVLKSDEITHTLQEQRILSQARHPFLIHLYSSFQTSDYLFLVMEYVPGGDLATQLAVYGALGLERSRFYAAEILLGLQELHRLGVVYRDLKPENVLLDYTGHLKLTDFGLSKQFSEHPVYKNNERTFTFCGTAEYLAPEILLEKAYSYEVDWWSFGTLLFEMITGFTPFWAENHQRMYQRVLYDRLEFPAEFTDVDARDIINGLLVREPSKRLGNYYGLVNGAEIIKRHIFFTAINFYKLYHKEVIPPYIPKLTDENDFRWFDQEFLNMSPTFSTFEEKSEAPKASPFKGYTYISSSAQRLMRINTVSPDINSSSSCINKKKRQRRCAEDERITEVEEPIEFEASELEFEMEV